MDDISIVTLITAVFFLTAAFIAVKSLRLPQSFFDNMKERKNIKEKILEEEIQEEIRLREEESEDNDNSDENKDEPQ